MTSLTLVTLALVGCVAAVPLNDDPVFYQNVRRTKNSLDLFNKKCHESSVPVIPVALSLQPQASYSSPQASYSSPQSQYYREHEAAGQDKQRSLYEVSASSYGAGASAQIGGLSPTGISAAGAQGSSAVGVFPQGQVSPCAKPLLLSCSPSVIAGHIIEQQHYAAPSYREVEEQLNHLHHHHHNHQNHHDGDSDEAVEKAAEMKTW